jgi:hypothetical protein
VFTNTIAYVSNVSSGASCKMYPNPNKGEFTIALQDAKTKCSVSIYNSLGQEVYNSVLNVDNTEININDKAKGLYLYRIVSESGKPISEGKFIIQ